MKLKRVNHFLEDKKFKAAWGCLKDPNLAGFELTIHAHALDEIEPSVTTMEFVRAENGEWNQKPHPRKCVDSPESDSELREKLEAIEASVKNYITTHSLDEKWRMWLDALRKVMELGRSTEYLEYHTEIPVRAIFGYGYDAHFFSPLMAMAHVIEGTEALKKRDLDRASHSVERGGYWSCDEMLISASRFSDRGQIGGNSKRDRYDGVKKKVEKLLGELAPEGWGTSTQAADGVADELTRKHSAFVEKSGLKTENLARTIKNWMKKAPGKYPHLVKAKK